MAGLALLVCGLLAGYLYAVDVARKAETAFLREQLAASKKSQAEGEQRVRDLVASIQGVHNGLTTQVAELNDRLSAGALGRASSSNPLRKTATPP